MLSDNYAVSIILPTLILCSSGHKENAKNLIKNCVVWLCDRFEKGFGIASLGSNEQKEINTLFGYPFEFIDVQKSAGSYASTILTDLAAFTGDSNFYKNVVNDIRTANMFPECWQPADTKGLFKKGADDVVFYANIKYVEDLTSFLKYDFADHIKRELDSFKITKIAGSNTLIILMLLLRDRYFPKYWPVFEEAIKKKNMQPV